MGDGRRDALAGSEFVCSAGDAIPSSICSRATEAESSRRVRSFSRHRRNKRRIDAGVSAGSVVESGSRSRIAASVSEMVSPANGAHPVSISWSTQPNDQMSVRLSSGLPRACSGLM
jgi:hypothetical protein